ncbi:UNVERIFIED_CONTAM: Kazn [Trichonephila clavipes]
MRIFVTEIECNLFLSGPMIQTLSPDHRPTLLSRSAEDIFNSAGIGELTSVKKKSKEKKGTWGSISRVFSRSKKRKPLDPELFENHRSSWCPKESVCSSPLNEESYVQKLRLLEETHGTPMQHWRAATVLAWLEITMDMPQYGAACAENIKSGKLLLELSDSELEEGLGITNTMHRRKLRLAIEEHRQPSLWYVLFKL